MELANWSLLRSGGEILVLAVNFDAGRGGSGFSDLAERLDGCTVWESAPLPATGDFLRESTPEEYVRPWLDEPVRNGRPVVAVLGLCAAAPLARLLAQGLREAGLGSPSVLLYDPLPVDGDTLAAEYQLALDPLRGQLAPAERAEFEQPAELKAAGRATSGADLVPGARALLGVYARAVRTVCERLGVDTALQSQLVDRFTSYLTYLLAASRADRPVGPSVGPSVVLSGDHTAPWPDAPGQTTRFEVPGTRLLADAGVAAFTEGALRR